MVEPRKVRMVECTYRRPGEKWVPMGRARTRCPSCGAVVQYERPDDPHYVELREASDG